MSQYWTVLHGSRNRGGGGAGWDYSRPNKAVDDIVLLANDMDQARFFIKLEEECKK